METSNKLQILLTHAAHFYMQLHIAHWNVEGIEFIQLHEFFGDLYSDVFESLDPIAENIRKLGEYAKLSPETVSESKLVGIGPTGDSKLLIGSILTNNELIIGIIKSCIESAKKENLYDIENFLAGRLEQHNKHSWMLKSLEK